MTRNFKAPALVLKVRPAGEHHRGVSMLVSGEGLISPFAYGAQGRRSGLRGTAVPFNRGIANLYYDGARQHWRLTAFDPEHTHDGFRENLDRFCTAETWAEILLKTHGSGEDSAGLFKMVSAAFAALSALPPEQISRIRVGFLWRFLEIEGIQPDPGICGQCGRPLNDGPAFYSPVGLLTGPECASGQWNPVSPQERCWLLQLSSQAPRPDAVPPDDLLKSTEHWLLTVIQTVLEKPLKSLSCSGLSG